MFTTVWLDLCLVLFIMCISYETRIGYSEKGGCHTVWVVFTWRILVEMPTVHSFDFICRYFILQLDQQRNVVLKNQMPELYSIKTCPQCDWERILPPGELSMVFSAVLWVVWHQSFYMHLSASRIHRKGVLDYKDR